MAGWRSKEQRLGRAAPRRVQVEVEIIQEGAMNGDRLGREAVEE
jgi:hypothetical protein